MNPIAIVLLLVAILLIIVGFKGKQDNLIATVKGSPYGKSTLR